MSTDAARTSRTPASRAGGIWAPARRPLTVGLVLAVTFVAFEALSVATILPTVGRHLGDLRLYGWVFSAFLLASLIGIVLAGTLAALALTASTLAWTAGSWVQARWITRCGPRRLVRPGECLIVIGLGLMCVVLLPSVPAALAIVALALAGAGIGTAYAPLSVTMLDRAAAGEEGRATSALQLCDVLGQAIGTGVAGAIVAATARIGHGPGVALAFSFAIVVALPGVIVGARLPEQLSLPATPPRAAGPQRGTRARRVPV